MHDYRSYQDNLSLASVHYSNAMHRMGCTASQGLGYCVDEIGPDKREDELVRILLYAAILRVGVRLGISPLTGHDPFTIELRDEIQACWKGLSKERLSALGAHPLDIDVVLKDVQMVSDELGISVVDSD